MPPGAVHTNILWTVPLTAWPSGDHRSSLVFITRVIDPERIAYSLETFQSSFQMARMIVLLGRRRSVSAARAV
jgi:hypothetical protein